MQQVLTAASYVDRRLEGVPLWGKFRERCQI